MIFAFSLIFTVKEIKLTTDNLSDQNHGQLIINIGEVEGAICAHGFTDTDASVACRQLGFIGGNMYRHPTVDMQHLVLMKDLKCNGSESSLFECPYTKWGDSRNCATGSEYAGVLCHRTGSGK